MGAKPGSLPRWADVGGAIVTPSSGKLDKGWVTAERPPAQYLNWYQNLVYLWVVFINAFFTRGGGAVGAIDIGNDVEATVAPLAAYRDYNTKLRAVVDHNGYRMGQLSEIDERWDYGAQTIQIPISLAAPVTGTWAWSGIWTCTAAGLLTVCIDGVVPKGAIVTSVVFSFSRQTGTDQTTFSWQGLVNGASPVNSCQKLITTGTGNTTTDLMVSPTAGQGPQQVGFAGNTVASTPVDQTTLLINANVITTSLKLYGITLTYYMPSPTWTYSQVTLGAATNGDVATPVDPASGFPQRGVKLVSTAVSATGGASQLVPTAYETRMDADLAYAMEFTIKTGTITDGSAHRIFQIGVQNNNGGSANRFVWLYSDNTFANWQLRVVGSSTTDTDTGVAIAATTVYRCKLEIYGANTSSAGASNYRIRLYINGALVANVTNANLPAGDMIRPYLKAAINGTTGGPYDVTIGRVRRVWNHLLTPDAI